MLDLILSALSIPESSKKANGISEDPSPKLGKLPLHASQVTVDGKEVASIHSSFEISLLRVIDW